MLQHGTRIVPVEVKAGSAGAMKSLHSFMHGKGSGLAVRLDSESAVIATPGSAGLATPPGRTIDLHESRHGRQHLLSGFLSIASRLRRVLHGYHPTRENGL